jgi:hypothetical protein
MKVCSVVLVLLVGVYAASLESQSQLRSPKPAFLQQDDTETMPTLGDLEDLIDEKDEMKLDNQDDMEELYDEQEEELDELKEDHRDERDELREDHNDDRNDEIEDH